MNRLSETPYGVALRSGSVVKSRAEHGFGIPFARCDAGSQSKLLKRRLERFREEDAGFRSFNLRRRSGNHALFQYPAMMVPELQGALLDTVKDLVPPAPPLVYDPFVGSGTIMLESLYRGFDFQGSDINPMAILLCEVKASPPTPSDARETLLKIVERAYRSPKALAPEFPRIDKWFKPEIKQGLANLRSSIMACDCLNIRRFLWICLAEAIRLVSNSRTSTFKLHTYTAEDIARRETDAIKVFQTVGTQNVLRLMEHWALLEDTRTSDIDLRLGSVLDTWNSSRPADILMTSPPYGDNKTTIPYGQHSYLPLCWIDGQDIPGGLDPSLLSSTSRIDMLSLGGSLLFADRAREELVSASAAFGTFIERIDHQPDLRRKVLAFTRDYRDALLTINQQLTAGAFCFFTLGERRVGKHEVPLVQITQEFLAAQGQEIITTIERTLPRSRTRMAAKNREGVTMAQEWILVTRASTT